MTAQFFDRQDAANSLNGTIIENPIDLLDILESVRGRPPFFAELIGDNGFKLLLGLGTTEGCVQISSVGHEPPYAMATDGRDEEGELEFLIGGTLTPVPRRMCLPYQTVKNIATYFVRTGQRSPGLRWVEI